MIHLSAGMKNQHPNTAMIHPMSRYEEPAPQYSLSGLSGIRGQKLRGDLPSAKQRLALAIVSVVALVVMFVAGIGAAIASGPSYDLIWVAVIALIIIYSIFTGAVIAINRLFSRIR